MGYQALLFCPDEKTARTVTQVLSELDFTVVPCTEPFAAVKKLMGEHFDAVVVDCDNEQNATLLFKSARNTAQNQSLALAVAVVEGQAGVAKAFRIGANLALTKPINVEQAKGTLRVARGLLRKNEGAKPATAGTAAAVKPATATAPLKPVPQRPIPAAARARAATPIGPLATVAKAIPAPKTIAQSSMIVSVPTESTDSDADIFKGAEEVPSASVAKPATPSSVPTSAPKISSASLSPAKVEPKIEMAGDQAASSGFGTSAASAPAPARELKPSVSTEDKSVAVVLEPDSPVAKVAANDSSSSVEQTAPAFTFGGNVSGETKSGGGSKKALIAVAAVALIAAGGYAAWMQWGHSSGTTSVPARATTQTTTTVPRGAPSAASTATLSTPSSPISSATSTPEPAGAPHATGTKTSPVAQTTASAENAPVRGSKGGSEAESSKPSASTVAANKVPAVKAPIVIKSGGSKPAAVSDAPAPSITGIEPARNGAALPNLMDSQSKAPTPVLQTVNISQGVSQGLLVKKVQPVYPANALQLRVEGAVELMATVSKSGDIAGVKILSGDAQLARAAVEAVKQWKYKPYLLNGSPVEIQTQVTVNFKLPR
jgi:protein TonB